MRTLWLTATHDIRLRFGDRAILLLTVVAPALLALLLEAAFGDLALGQAAPDMAFDLAIVNQDAGSAFGAGGEALIQLVRSELEGRGALTVRVRDLDSAERARRMVEHRELAAALVIPSAFSAALARGEPHVQLILPDAEDVRGLAIRNVVGETLLRLFVARLAVAVAAQGIVNAPEARSSLASGMLAYRLADVQARAMQRESAAIIIQRIDQAPASRPLRLPHHFAAAIAVFMTGLTALVGSASLLHDHALGTLQRMLAAPLRRELILAGKALGAYLSSVMQMAVLALALALIGAGAGRSPATVDAAGMVVLILATAAAATGLGALVAGASGRHDTAVSWGRLLLLVMGMLGGVFIPTSLFPLWLQDVSHVTFHYWAMDGYLALAAGGDLSDIIRHVTILTVMGAALYVSGVWLLRRRLGLA